MYGFKSAEEAKAFKLNPVDNLEPLAKAGIPIIHVVGDLDKLVPWPKTPPSPRNATRKWAACSW